jgi:subtilisin family serine protease
LILKKTILLFILLSLCFQLKAQVFFIEFANKKSSYTFNNPSAYLSNRAILRRSKQNIKIDSTDLPLVPKYVDSIIATGVKIVGRTKWLNGVLITTQNQTALNKVYSFPFVKSHIQVKNAGKSSSQIHKFEESNTELSSKNFGYNDYGYAATQIKMCNIDFLHREGFTGKGMQIAVLDGGFKNVHTNDAFTNLFTENRVLDFYDFVHQRDSVFTDAKHGASVLSCMSTNEQQYFVGTSPDASFYLYETEDVSSEYPVEEYFWSIGAEKADSSGADLINSSLGYNWFDDAKYNHAYIDMDGKTCPASKAASLAGSKGMIVCISAGNEGASSWFHIGTPADAKNILTVGAVDEFRKHAYFSSYGYSADRRVKPSVCTMGENTALISDNNSIEWGSGTSFASPLLCGMAACLWQKYADKTALEIEEAIMRSANFYQTPTDSLGYGIPDFSIADKLLSENIISINTNEMKPTIFPNPCNDLNLYLHSDFSQNCKVEIYSPDGVQLIQESIPTYHHLNAYLMLPSVAKLNKGVYLISIYINYKKYNLKWVKM